MVRVLYGDEPYLIDHNKRKLLAGIEEYSLTLADKYSDDLLSSLGSSLFGRTGLVIRDNVPTKSEAFKKFIKEDKESEDYVVVFLPKSVDMRSTVTKDMLSLGMIKKCDKFKRERVHCFIRQILADKGITEEMIDRLILRTGYYEDSSVNLYTLEIAARKLSFVEEKSITEEVLGREVEENITGSAFALSELLFAGRKKEYFSLYEKLTENEASIGLLALILRTVRIGYKSRLGFSSGELGVNPMAVKCCQKLDISSIKTLLETFTDATNKIKCGMAERDAFISASLMAFDILFP